MGLFSAFIFGFGVMALFALAYVAARFFQPTSVAVRIAAVFSLGSAVGVVATLLVLSVFVPPTLTQRWQVIAYLLSLGAGAFGSGVALMVLYIKRRVLTRRSSEQPTTTT
jgi:hypothetical protein